MLRVVVIGPSQAQYKEADCAEAITPGHLVKLNASGGLIKNTLAGRAPVMVAVENDIFGKGIDDAWASGERGLYQHLQPGHEYMALVAAAAPAIAFDDLVTAVAGGTVAKTVTLADAIGRARAAVDNSGGGTQVRLRIEVI